MKEKGTPPNRYSPRIPPHYPPSHLTGPATGWSEARYQDTDNQFYRAWIRPGQGPSHDLKDTGHNSENVYSSLGHRGSNLVSDPSICKGSRVQRSPYFHSNFQRRGGKQEKIQGAVQSLDEEEGWDFSRVHTVWVEKITGKAVSMNMSKA
jgi:hypothetical protein